MKKTFERVADQLYKRQYQSAKGQWRTIFHGIFTDWKGKRGKVPLDSNLTAAKKGLTLRLSDNVNEVGRNSRGSYPSAQN